MSTRRIFSSPRCSASQRVEISMSCGAIFVAPPRPLGGPISYSHKNGNIPLIAVEVPCRLGHFAPAFLSAVRRFWDGNFSRAAARPVRSLHTAPADPRCLAGLHEPQHRATLGGATWGATASAVRHLGSDRRCARSPEDRGAGPAFARQKAPAPQQGRLNENCCIRFTRRDAQFVQVRPASSR